MNYSANNLTANYYAGNSDATGYRPQQAISVSPSSTEEYVGAPPQVSMERWGCSPRVVVGQPWWTHISDTYLILPTIAATPRVVDSTPIVPSCECGSLGIY